MPHTRKGCIVMKMPKPIDLTGKVAIVTGAGGVLCSDMARALAMSGAAVALADINYDAVKAVADELNAQGCRAFAVQANVLDRDALEQAYAKIKEALGPCDILVNGAGGNNPKATTDGEYFRPEALETDEKTFFDLDKAGVEFVFGLNFLGTLLPTQVFAKDMATKGKGWIVNISSMNAFTPLTKIPAYSAAKAAVSNFTQWLAVHFSKVGVRVNAMAPGFFQTAQNQKLLFNPDGSPSERTGKILRNTPMERFGTPDELLGTLLYLLNDDYSSFVTGVVIPIDGGFAAYSGV